MNVVPILVIAKMCVVGKYVTTLCCYCFVVGVGVCVCVGGGGGGWGGVICSVSNESMQNCYM